MCSTVLRPPFFFAAKNARAEVPIAGNVLIGGVPYPVRGEIDRLIIEPEAIHLVDFKTNRNVPESISSVPSAYILQVALYRKLIQTLYPEKSIRSYICWTKDARLMLLPEQLLDDAVLRTSRGSKGIA